MSTNDEKRKRGRPRKVLSGVSETQHTLGRDFEPNTAYVVGQLTQASASTPKFPEWKATSLRRQFFGREMINKGITTTAQFYAENPLNIATRKLEDWWHIYSENKDGTEEYFARGQFKVNGEPTTPRKSLNDDSTGLIMNPNANLSEQLATHALHSMMQGTGQSKEMLLLFIQKQQEDIEYLRGQNAEKDAEIRNLRDKCQNLEIRVSSFDAEKRAEIAIARQEAKAEQQKEDEEIYKQVMEEHKTQQSGGLSGLLSDPSTLVGILQHAPAAIAALRSAYQDFKNGRTEQPDQTNNGVAYDENGTPLRQIPQTMH